MRWMIVVILWVVLEGAWALSKKELEPAEMYLKNFSPEQVSNNSCELVLASYKRLRNEVSCRKVSFDD